MSPLVSKSEATAPVIDALLAFLWQQWARLGVSGDVADTPDRWLIDPEALLLFTLDLGRFDPRLFEEVLDWCVRNEEWLSVQRLKSLIRLSDRSELQIRTLHAFAAIVQAHTRSSRWKALIGPVENHESVPFFRERTGEPFPVFGKKEDPYFLAAGLTRSPVTLRGLSLPPSLAAPACLILKLRALFGHDPRAEVIAYLMTHRTAGGRELARAAVYAPSTVHTVLTRLVAGGFLLSSARHGYELDHNRWLAFLGESSSAPLPAWVDWARVLPALSLGMDALLPEQPFQESSYLRASRYMRIGEQLREALVGSGLPNPFAAPWHISEAEERLPANLFLLAEHLSMPPIPH